MQRKSSRHSMAVRGAGIATMCGIARWNQPLTHASHMHHTCIAVSSVAALSSAAPAAQIHHSHSTVAAQSQHSRSATSTQHHEHEHPDQVHLLRCQHPWHPSWARSKLHSHSTVTAQSQHSRSTVAAQSQRVDRPCHRIASTNLDVRIP